MRLTTGNLATALNAYLNGKIGEVTVPIRIHVAPDVTVRTGPPVWLSVGHLLI